MSQTKGEEPGELKGRTKQFTLRIVRLYSALPSSVVAQVLGKHFDQAHPSGLTFAKQPAVARTRSSSAKSKAL